MAPNEYFGNVVIFQYENFDAIIIGTEINIYSIFHINLETLAQRVFLPSKEIVLHQTHVYSTVKLLLPTFFLFAADYIFNTVCVWALEYAWPLRCILKYFSGDFSSETAAIFLEC